MDRAGVSGEHVHSERTECPRLALQPLPALGEPMMESDSEPLDEVSAAALLARVIRDIDQSTEAHRDVLLSALLCAAWPTRPAQDQ